MAERRTLRPRVLGETAAWPIVSKGVRGRVCRAGRAVSKGLPLTAYHDVASARESGCCCFSGVRLLTGVVSEDMM